MNRGLLLLLLLVFITSCTNERICDNSDDSIDFSLTKYEIVEFYQEALVDSPKLQKVFKLCANGKVSKIPIQVQSYRPSKSKNLELLINQKGDILLETTMLDSLQQIEFALRDALIDSSYAQYTILPLWDKQTGHDVVKSVILYLDETIRKNYSYDSIKIVFNKPRDVPPPPPIK